MCLKYQFSFYKWCCFRFQICIIDAATKSMYKSHLKCVSYELYMCNGNRVASSDAAIVLSGKCISNFTEFCHHYVTNAQTSDNKLCIQYSKAEQLITIYFFFLFWICTSGLTWQHTKWNEMSLCINYFASRILENLSKCYNVTNNFPSDKRFCCDPGT